MVFLSPVSDSLRVLNCSEWNVRKPSKQGTEKKQKKKNLTNEEIQSHYIIYFV